MTVTCDTCRHFSLTMPTTRFGACAVNASGSSWTAGVGYGFSPAPRYERTCDAWEAKS